MDTAKLCGGGTGGSLQLSDLPMGYTLGYEKVNGCPVQLAVSRCSLLVSGRRCTRTLVLP